jgi:hypothetical protein
MNDFLPATDAERIAHWPVVDEDGRRVGVIVALYTDAATDTLQWAGVESGVAGRRRHLVPLAGAFEGDGFLQVAYARERIERSPVPDDTEELTHAVEEALYHHFGLPWLDEQPGSGHEPEGAADTARRILVRRPSLLERFGYS